jgi:PRTRC genetic system protein E
MAEIRKSHKLVQSKPTQPHEEKKMFTELMPLLRKRRLLLTLTLVEGDTIRATVVPQKSSETEDSAITTPLAITGTAEEIDRELPGQLVSFVGAHLQLQSTLATAKAEMDAAAKAAREEVRKRNTKPVTTPTTESAPKPAPEPPPEPPPLFAEQTETKTARTEDGGGCRV